MPRILYFDIAGIPILLIILFSLIDKKMLSGRSNKFMILLLTQIIATAILDLWASSYGVWIPATKQTVPVRTAVCYFYFFLRNLTPPLYYLFICSVTDTLHIVKKSKLWKFLLIIPYLIICVTLISNLFFHKVFYFNENLAYCRGVLIYILYACSGLYLVSGVIYLILYRKMITRDKFIAMLLMYPLNVIAVLIQLFCFRLLVEIFMTSLSMLLIIFAIQRPEEIINPVLGVRNYIAYTSDMKKVFLIKKPVRIILARLSNYQMLSSFLEYETRTQLLKDISSDLTAAYKSENLPMDLYYLEDGLFALVTEKDCPQKLKNAAEKISKIMTTKKQVGNLNVELKSCVCILKCPENIDVYEMLLSFGNSFHTYFTDDGILTDFSEEKDKKFFYLRVEIDRIVRRALNEHRFQLYYQPIYSIKEKKFLSAEALIRLYDEEYGFISPELFIPAAEKNGMILEIGDFVLNETCNFLSKCKQNGLPIDFIELNLSMNQCMQTNLREKVLHFMNKYELQPEQLNLEITETVANEEQKIVEENIWALTKENLSFSLDDYGTGYSNLSRIMELPFHIIKMDKSLADRVNNKKINVLFRNTIKMLHEIGMEIVVEGIESEENFKLFSEMGCDYIQGYYFSKPLPESEFIKFIKSH